MSVLRVGERSKGGGRETSEELIAAISEREWWVNQGSGDGQKELDSEYVLR